MRSPNALTLLLGSDAALLREKARFLPATDEESDIDIEADDSETVRVRSEDDPLSKVVKPV